jgi:hypothetical protein
MVDDLSDLIPGVSVHVCHHFVVVVIR